MSPVAFFIQGIPAPQGSKTPMVRSNGVVVVLEGASTTGRRKHATWRKIVTAAGCAQRVGATLPDRTEPLEADLHFVMPKPKSAPKWLRWAIRKPDLDKLVRAALDGLADAALIAQDQQVVELHTSKRYVVGDEPSGCFVALRGIAHDDAPGARADISLR